MQEIHARHALTPAGWADDVRLTLSADGRIADVVSGGPLSSPVDLLLPAPVNLHSHTFQRAMAGLTETRGPDPTDSFWTWRRLMFRFLERLDPDDVEAIAAMVYVEMLEAGYAAVAEFHYLHHAIGGVPYADPAEMGGRIVAAAEATGIGLTLLPVLYMQGGCDGRALVGGQRRFGSDLDLYARMFEASADMVRRADHGIGVAPHSLRAVPPHALHAAVGLAPECPIHLHLAEQVAEVAEVEAHLGARPVTWLLDRAPVDARWCLIHCTQMTATETLRLAESGAIAGLCPITESSLGDGIFPATTFAEAGGRFGVGSDSNIHVALWEELATLEYSQRLRDRSRAALATRERSTGRILFDAALDAGAAAAGRRSGAVAVGHQADLVAISTANEVLCEGRGDTLLDRLLVSGRARACVTDVWSAGRHVVEGGRHRERDSVVARYRSVMAGLRDAL
ncbi:MAG: formimidoylglutamate deiminase [Pseudomonadota bacterium]